MMRLDGLTMRAAQAGGDHWASVAKACLEALGRPLPGANLGLLYITETLADDLPSILTFLRETTQVQDWAGAVGFGVFGPLGEIYQRPAISLLTARVPPGAVRLLDQFKDIETFRADHGAWLDEQSGVSGLMHGDPHEEQLGRLMAVLADDGQVFTMGGITPLTGSATQFAGRITGAGLSGLLFGDKAEIVTSLTQGCAPIGPTHRISHIVDNIVMELDGRSALDVLKEEAGDLIARDLKRAAGLIHIAMPIENSDTSDYLVRNLLAVDPRHGWIAIGTRLTKGDNLMFVRRDPNTAQDDMRRMLKAMAKRIDGRFIKGGVYISCVGRGPNMFGAEGREIAMIHDALGEFPLIGLAANGEFFHNRLYTYTGVLTLFL